MKLDDLRLLVGKRVLLETRRGRKVTGEIFDWDPEQGSVSIDDEESGLPYMVRAASIESAELLPRKEEEDV